MAKKPDTPCAGGCGRMLWTGPKSLPAGQRMCRQCRTEAADDAPAVAQEDDASPPSPREPSDGFAARGRRLWRAINAEGNLSPLELILLEESCRIADRCDQLDDFLRGREGAWMRFHARNEDGSVVEVVIDKALSEARQQATALRGLVAELRASRGKQEGPKPEASKRDELAKRREERRKAAGL